jgi:hypothetical protein
VVFTEGHHLKSGVSSLMFLPLPIGGIISVVMVSSRFISVAQPDKAHLQILLFINPAYARKVEEFAPNPVPPEYRLRPAMVAGPLFSASFFWFA